VYAQWIYPHAHDMGRAPLELVAYPARLHFDEPVPYREMSYLVTLPNFRELRFGSHKWGPGLDLVPELQYAMWCSWSRNFRSQISKEQYLDAWREEARQLRPCFDVHWPREPFLALHLRRGDKSDSDVAVVEDETRRIVTACLETHKTWAIVSDSAESAAAFADFIAGRGGRILPLPETETKVERMLTEFFWITAAGGVLQSVGQRGQYGGFSSFSYLPALMAQIPLISCVPREKMGDTRFQDYARVNAGRLNDIFYNREVDAFLRRMADGPRRGRMPVAACSPVFSQGEAT